MWIIKLKGVNKNQAQCWEQMVGLLIYSLKVHKNDIFLFADFEFLPWLLSSSWHSYYCVLKVLQSRFSLHSVCATAAFGMLSERLSGFRATSVRATGQSF